MSYAFRFGDVHVRISSFLEAAVGFSCPTPTHGFIGKSVVQIDGQPAFALWDWRAGKQMAYDANDSTQDALVGQRSMECSHASLGRSSNEDS